MSNFCQSAVNTKPMNFNGLKGFNGQRAFKFGYREIWNLNNMQQYKQDRLNCLDLRNMVL